MYEKLSPFASIYLLTAVVAVLTAGALPSQIVLQAPGDDYDESILLTRTRQLTFAGLRAGEGYFSPDGTHLTLQSEREPGNPFYQIYDLDLTMGDLRRISPGIGKTTCSFFRPGADEVLFATSHLDKEARAKQKDSLRQKGALIVCQVAV